MPKPNGLRERAKNFIARNPLPKHAGIGTPVKPFILIEYNGDGTLSISSDRVSPLQGAEMCHQAEGKMMETLNLYMFSEAKKIEDALAAITPQQEAETSPAAVQEG